ncbi:hypothetical protein [Spirosoma foliorum]|uniref:Methyltransferase n=1 Tax=Spirosoma foliorum TaxID=2710596 RepID=A0A7G5H2S3_9BACT|nr:hypothetical protein [Spirosoma foliorum]QMW05415.1 hypothetical protein H3H32_11235 [Spirosoma foliorum]
MGLSKEKKSVDASYQKRLVARLQRVHQRHSGDILPLANYLDESLGAFPTDVEKALNQALIPYSSNYTFEQVTKRRAVKDTSFLADEHPNDFDWRFDLETVNYLVKRVGRNFNSNERVALFGVKTILPALVEGGVNTVLYERSTSLIQDFYQQGYASSVIQHDLLKPIYDGRTTYDLVVADPPWYLDFYEAYLDRGSELLEIGGEFWLSVLPSLTRPSASSDRRAILGIATQRGFQLMRKIPRVLIYKTPAFERHVLSINEVKWDNWRSGDLWIFKKVKDTLIAPQHALHLNQAAWTEYRIGYKKIQLRKESDDRQGYFNYWPTNPDGKFFHSVSRRATERNQITIWTSDNIAFTVVSVHKLIPFLDFLQSGYSLSETINRVFSVQSLAQAEQHKIVALLKELDISTE